MILYMCYIELHHNEMYFDKFTEKSVALMSFHCNGILALWAALQVASVTMIRVVGDDRGVSIT